MDKIEESWILFSNFWINQWLKFRIFLSLRLELLLPEIEMVPVWL